MPDSDGLSSTLEDYLQAMARVIAATGAARVRDIAAALSVHKSTVTAALRSLSQKGLVAYAPYEIARLTPKGQKAARRIARRHEVIRRFLVEVLAVSEEMAEANACRMEHDLDREVLERLRLFAEFVKRCPHCGKEQLRTFHRACQRDSRATRTGENTSTAQEVE